jgi:chromosome segregation ATPase
MDEAMRDRSESRSSQNDRHRSEISMESFIRHHMMVILQPMSEQLQELDDRVAKLDESLNRTDANAVDTLKKLDGNSSEIVILKEGLDHANVNLSKCRQAIVEAGERDEMLQQGLELANGFAQRMHNQIEVCTAAVPELQRGIEEFDCQLQALRANVQRTSDSIDINIQSNLDTISSDLEDLRTTHLKTNTDLGNLRFDVNESRQYLEDTHQLLDKTCISVAQQQKSIDNLSSKENQLGARLNDWKTQWSKLQPRLEALTKESAHFKQLTDHHEAGICSLQQGYATNFSTLEALQKQHVQTTFDLQTVQENLCGTQRDINSCQEGLRQTNACFNTLQCRSEKTDAELRRVSLKLDGVDAKHTALCDTFDKTNGCVAELSKEHRRSVNCVQNLKQELDKTNDCLTSARNQLEATDSNMHGLKNEIGRTCEVVHRLDQGMEVCQAAFTGLQKGFAETGVTVSRRSSALPRLSKVEGKIERPSSATESTASCMSSRRTSMFADEEAPLRQKV